MSSFVLGHVVQVRGLYTALLPVSDTDTRLNPAVMQFPWLTWRKEENPNPLPDVKVSIVFSCGSVYPDVPLSVCLLMLLYLCFSFCFTFSLLFFV